MMASNLGARESAEAKVLRARGKRATAAYIHADCSNTGTSPRHLNELLDSLLNPAKPIDDWDTIDWCKWLIAGGRTPDEFNVTVRGYDNATTCGLVWTPDFVAYRCRTCGISPCMSLCTECFKKGNHQRHDFNMFLSQAGGACDCGDTSVMKETGFCDRHGPNRTGHQRIAPSDLMCVAEAMMPRIIFRLILHLRENSNNGTPDTYKGAIRDADSFISMLLEFSDLRGLMHKVMASALTNPQKYRELNEFPDNPTTEYGQYLAESKKIYEKALNSFETLENLEEAKDCPLLQEKLVHKTFLEELVFWTVKFEFPQKVVCFLLKMLPVPDYKEALTKAFVLHYSRISMMLERSNDPDTLSNRMVHVSVQLFSNEGLALRMAEEMNLLHVMVISLKYMMSKILVQSTLHDADKNFHLVIDCGKKLMREHCYWPLVSDLNNLLSHRHVALKFMADDSLRRMWFKFIATFQGMNVNHRELNQHVEFEPNTYYAAFSLELEASAYPMWALVSHLNDLSTAHLTRRVLKAVMNELMDWLKAINFIGPSMNDYLQVSFHLPLHRYLAVFLCQAVAKQGITLDEVLPANETFKLMMHPLRLQVAFYEILNGLWVRNGLQIKGQAMTYIQCNFSNVMVDADLYLLQICSTRIPADNFLNIVIENFHIKEWMSLSPYQAPQNAYLEGDHDTPMLESFLTFLATLISVRTNLGLSETALNRLEMVTLLCTGDKTHSQLLEQMPEKYGTSQSRDFEALLAEIADYRAPTLDASGNMQQGMYVPKAQVWEEQYDPIYVLLRAVHRRDFQTSMDRYTEYARQSNKLKPGISPWPPFRTPSKCGTAYEDPRLILKSRVFHAAALVILYKAVKGYVSEQVMALVVFLLEQAIIISEQADDFAMDTRMCPSPSPIPSRQLKDMELSTWYRTDNIFDNLTATVHKVVLTPPEPEVSPMTYSSDSESEWDNTEMDSEMSDIQYMDTGNMLTFDADWESSSYVSWRATLPSSDLSSTSMSTDNLALALTTSRPSVSSQEDAPGPSALPAPAQLPALMAGNEVARQSQASSSSTELVPSTSRTPVRMAQPDSWSTELVPSTSNAHRKTYACRKRQTIEGSPTSPPTVKINESIISLLLKLHSNLSGIPDSFVLEDELAKVGDEPMIGDGAFFIGRLLRKMAMTDDNCKRNIAEIRTKLWPTQEKQEDEKKAKDTKEREERRRRAKERQQKLMAEFASKQRQFMEKMESNEGEDMKEEERLSKQEYDCVICNQSTPSTEEKPMGLVVLVQATSVVGYRRRVERSDLPLSREDAVRLGWENTLSSEFDKRIEILDRHFDPQSWFLSVNSGWDGGVHVQTCGHHLHLDCLNSYLRSLRSQQRQPSLSPEKGEYLCPLCRQLANSVLPLSQQLGDCNQVVRSRPTSMSQVIDELGDFLRENVPRPNVSNMSEAIGKMMDDMSSCTPLKPIFKLKNDKPIPHSLFLFITSIARTNLEVELIQRGGSLVVQEEPPNPLQPKRDCVVPLLHVLAVHAQVARGLAKWAAWTTVEQLSGITREPASALAPVEREVPLLLRDPTALLLQFVLLLPLHLDQIYLTSTIQLVYNLLYYQIVAQIALKLTDAERTWLLEASSTGGAIVNLTGALRRVNEFLRRLKLYIGEDARDRNFIAEEVNNIVALEQQVQQLCLPFLRIAALLKYHLYRQPLPDILSTESEFVRLVYYLELVTEPMDWESFNAAVALNWPTSSHESTPKMWFEQLENFAYNNEIAAREFIQYQHVRWHLPRLLQLPREYEKIFTYYHKRQCSQCHSVPQETSVCLLCGTIVCLKQGCCKHQNVCEAVYHAHECGAGTGIFLVVTSTYIIVIRGHRACLWGSLYLDEFEEEDRDLKRGKPLYLSQDRYKLLEQQWLAHRFDHTKKNWVQHRNAL